MVSKTGEAESITSHYLFALGSYRALYILNWIYRYASEDHYDLIAIVAGIVQTVLYCDFFYLYITKGKSAAFSRIHTQYQTCFYSVERKEAAASSLRKQRIGGVESFETYVLYKLSVNCVNKRHIILFINKFYFDMFTQFCN